MRTDKADGVQYTDIDPSPDREADMAYPLPPLAWVQAHVPDATAAYVLPGPVDGPLVIGVVGPDSAPLGMVDFNGRRVEFRLMESRPAPDPRFGPTIRLI
jgi:hypothetical protein